MGNHFWNFVIGRNQKRGFSEKIMIRYFMKLRAKIQDHKDLPPELQ